MSSIDERTAPGVAEVRAHLNRVLASRAFLKADSLAQLLRFVVEEELAGNRGKLREQVIAEDVFRRRDFDPRADTVVRTQARRLRERLRTYYDSEGRDQPVRIVLERGSYVPIFQRVDDTRGEAADVSVAVLPFLNLTGNPDEEYFTDGLTEEIINVLARIRGLKIVARTSAFAFKARDVDVREIGARLKVASILEGSVRRSGDRLRVTAQLVNAATGFHHWSENYDRPTADVLYVQDEIAASIAATLLGTEWAVPQHAPLNVEAYQLHLRGKQALLRVTGDGVQQAMELFGRAMALDPKFAPSPAFLAMTLALIGWLGMAPPDEVLPRARELAERARALDPSSIEARQALAWIRFAYEHDVAGALADFDALFDIAPSEALSRIPQAYALIALRRFDEAAAAIRRALELDPLSVVNIYNQAVVAYYAEQWDDLRRFSLATVERAPEFAEGHLGVGVAAMQAGQFADALASLEKAVSLNATIGVEYIVTCYCRMAQWDRAKAALERLTALARFSYVAPHRFAVATSAFPDPEQCLTHLERAKDVRDPRLIWIAAWPAFASLRGLPRFQRICRDLGVPS